MYVCVYVFMYRCVDVNVFVDARVDVDVFIYVFAC